MAPEGSTLEESNRNLDEITDLAVQLQNQTGIKVLWVTCNLFAHQRSLFYFVKQKVKWQWNADVFAWMGALPPSGCELVSKHHDRFLNGVTGTWMGQPPTQTVTSWPMRALRLRRAWILPRNWVLRTLVWLISVTVSQNIPMLLECFYPTVSLSPQCSGEEGKASSLSTIQMLLLNWSTWPTSSKWLSVSVNSKKKTLIKAQLGYVAVSCVLFVTRVQREDWAQVSVPDRTQTQGALQAPVWLWYVSSNARFESDSANDAFDVSLFYFVDAMSVIGFLKHYGLESHFKLNIEPNHTTLAGHSYEHDIVMASAWDILTHTTHLWALSWQCTTATWHIAFCGIFAFCKTASACWVQLTQTLALLTWGGTRTSSPWTSGTPPWSWRWAVLFHLKCICWQCLWC